MPENSPLNSKEEIYNRHGTGWRHNRKPAPSRITLIGETTAVPGQELPGILKTTFEEEKNEESVSLQDMAASFQEAISKNR